MKTEDDKWEGLSIDLWQIVAGELGVAYELEEFSRRRQAIDALQSKKIDLILQMNVSETNEILMDMSHSYHRSGLAIAVPQKRPV